MMISFQAVPHSDQVVDVYRDGKIIGDRLVSRRLVVRGSL